MMCLWECVTCLLLISHLTQANPNDDTQRYDVTAVLGGAPVVRDLVDLTSRPGSHGVIIPRPLDTVNRTAYVTNWTVHFRGASGKVRLQIWRPRPGGGQAGEVLFYALIGQTDLQDAALIGNGTHAFPVWPTNHIRLAPNDTIGLEFVDANPVSYSTSTTCKQNSSSAVWMQSMGSTYAIPM